ncbi:MAG: M20/M25/M40 family metallo-hydrolase [Phycisphaerae bacterium]|nr:M20/M25/M40 family metallo-hydrolase [Phycisphaerae bacterium]
MTALDPVRRAWYEAASSRIDEARMSGLIRRLTDVHSPTGAERIVCQLLAEELTASGLHARYQAVQGDSGNCIARVPGSGDGPTVLLYSPIDTHLDAEPAEDVPWVGPELRADMLPRTLERDGTLIGLGSSNPKSMVVSIVEAVRAVVEAGVPLAGDVVAAFCGGGMPWIAVHRGNAGVGSGVSHLLSHGVTADAAVIVKTWDEVYHEHPGMAWFRITVAGSMGYAGVPRGIPEFRSSIVPAARLILELEDWLVAYPERHRSGEILPQGWVSAVQAGWPTKPAFPSAATEIYVDIRTNPDQSLQELETELKSFVRSVAERLGDVDARVDMVVSYPGARTDPGHWIVKSALRAWQATHGRPYPGPPAMSGISDAAGIQRAGIPIVRIGYPFRSGDALPEEFRDGLGGMGAAAAADLVGTVRQIIHIVVDTCTRTRHELTRLHAA